MTYVIDAPRSFNHHSRPARPQCTRLPPTNFIPIGSSVLRRSSVVRVPQLHLLARLHTSASVYSACATTRLLHAEVNPLCTTPIRHSRSRNTRSSSLSLGIFPPFLIHLRPHTAHHRKRALLTSGRLDLCILVVSNSQSIILVLDFLSTAQVPLSASLSSEVAPLRAHKSKTTPSRAASRPKAQHRVLKTKILILRLQGVSQAIVAPAATSSMSPFTTTQVQVSNTPAFFHHQQDCGAIIALTETTGGDQLKTRVNQLSTREREQPKHC